MNFQTKLDALTDDDLWHIAGQVAKFTGGSLCNVSQHDCISMVRASFMNPDSGREYLKASRITIPEAAGNSMNNRAP